MELDASGYVRQARRSADLSQRGLAERVGVAQPAICRIEGGGSVDLAVFERILATAGMHLTIVDETGAAVDPLREVWPTDAAGRRPPAHLDMHAAPEHPTIKQLLRAAVPRPTWYHHRAERDRLRANGAAASRLQPVMNARYRSSAAATAASGAAPGASSSGTGSSA